MSATLQSPPRSPAPTPPPPASRRHRTLVLGALIVVVAVVAVSTALTRSEPTLVEPVTDRTTAAAAASGAPAQEDAGDAATGAPAAAAGPGVADAAAGTARAKGGAPSPTAEQLAELPPEIRKRIRQDHARRAHDPDRRPRRKSNTQNTPPPNVDRDDRRVERPAEQGPNRIEVGDQRTDGSSIQVSGLRSELPSGFVVVQRATPGGPGRVLGVELVRPGSIDGLRVKLEEPLTGRTKVFVSLYHDDLEPGVFVRDVDRLVIGSRGPITALITVTPS